MIDPQILTYAGLVFVLTLTPGADTMMVIKNALAHGRRGGLLTVLGVNSGLIVHAMLSGAGLSLILVQSAAAFEVVKLLGAGYLVYLGAKSVWGLFHTDESLQDEDTPHITSDRGAWSVYAQGLWTNVLNPKVAVFYLAFLPQFMNPGDAVLLKSVLLACIHATMGVLWLSVVTLAVATLRAWLARPRVRAALEAVSGFVLIGFGVRLALERN